MDFKELEKYILKNSGTYLDYPFGEGVAVYKNAKNKMFALINQNKVPLRISLKCDPSLSELLRQEYDEVQPGYHLNKKHWNTIVLTGQLEEQQVRDLIDLSFRLVK